MKKSVAYLIATALVLTSAMAIGAPVAQATGYTFIRNLTVGDTLTLAEASALKADLVLEGLWNSATPISTYNSAVASAVTSFQNKYASDILAPNGLTQGNGFFGFFTRAKINSLYGYSGGTQSAQCPAGLTCIPIVQMTTTGCPAGFTCTLNNSYSGSATNPSAVMTNDANLLAQITAELNSRNNNSANTSTYVLPTYTLPTYNLSTSSNNAAANTVTANITNTPINPATSALSSSQVYILSQIQPETWQKTFDQRIVTQAAGQVAAFLVTSSAATRGYYLGTFPTGATQTSGSNLVIATNTIPYAKTALIPKGTYYVKIVARQSGSNVSTTNVTSTVLLPTSGASAVSRSAITISMPPPYIIVTAPISNESWKNGSVHVVTWVANFKRSDSRNTPYAAVAITIPYGIGPAKTADPSNSSAPSRLLTPPGVSSNNSSSLPTPPTPPGFPSLPSLPTPPGLPSLPSLPTPPGFPGIGQLPFGIPSLSSLPSLPLGLPSPVSVLNDITGGIFGKSTPFAVSVNIKAVSSSGKSYLVSLNNYLENGRAPIILRVPAGQYHIVVSVPLVNVSTRKIETISGTSSLITVQ